MTRSLATTRPGILSIITLTLLASAACLDAAERGSPNTRWTTIGPPVGTLLIDGGHDQGKAKDAFLSLVGDPEALIVVIPTAGADEACEEDSPTIEALRQRGAKNVKVLHTRRRAVANTDEFVAPLKEAKGVWMAGGRQSRLAKAYLHTLTHRELFGVLERGGVIAGTSAGASIQGSYLYGGQSAGEVGFGFVRDAAIGQHFVRRRRHLPETSGLPKVVARNPGLLGIGIDEETFIIVRGDVFTVGGYGKVAIADATRPNWPGEEPHEFFIPGDAYDMKQRRAIVHRASNAENQWDGAKKE
ncbi:MAG: cyanophycinase [Pirellulaceae bacterium]|nr:cyanophycinase [Pirellulaceae bacterium]